MVTLNTPKLRCYAKKALFTTVVVVATLEVAHYRAQSQIDEALAERLPEAMKQIQAEQEEAALKADRESVLASWAAAPAQPEGRHIYGSLSAQFTFVEFSDLECPYCKRFHDTPKTLVDQSGGKVNWEWWHYPLAFHSPGAMLGAQAAECVAELAGNQAFWAFTGEWFKRSELNGAGVESAEQLAQLVGAPAEPFKQCLASEKYKAKVEQQIAKGTELGVTGTPATFVVDNMTGNRVLVRGAQTPQVLLEAMKQAIAMRDAPSSQGNPPAPAEASSTVPEAQAKRQ
ncbi:Protein-disulfide isomerase [Azotobacter beijerinckii]|uniref:Protein-disulfide isomerase n=1 Tax=Azotobacter beijerinckii TaxID=170623 RepID=A0A1H9PPP5_9GAMM|nr:DsbA family protein [Azotobacter beijerinckii]SER50316.1 Protein-disulfide isomerase [Azotobacter beijerinckii]